MFCIYFLLKHNIDTVQQVEFETLSNSSVDVHKSPLPSDLADYPPTVMQELRPDTSPRTT